MPRYHIGTSGWQYDHWRPCFYPRDLPKKDWFGHYAGVFPCVELNNSFYRQPKDETWEAWRRAAPAGFRFAVKANRYLTHMKRFKDPEDALERFFGGAERLKSHLGPILYQAPPDFRCDDGNLERLDAFAALLPRRLDHVFEFRHASWYGDEGLSLLRRHRIGHCVQDMPKLDCPVTATARHAYFRFHGAGRRYGGRYSDEELSGWAARIRRLEDVDDVWIFFNNDLGGHAVDNALKLTGLLDADSD